MYNDLVTMISYIHKQGKIYVYEIAKNLVENNYDIFKIYRIGHKHNINSYNRKNFIQMRNIVKSDLYNSIYDLIFHYFPDDIIYV